MNTLINNQEVNHSMSKVSSNENSVSDFWKKAEYNRFGIIPMLLLVIACLGGVAASFGAGTNAFQLGLTIFPTIISLAFMLAVAPMRLIVWSCAIALFFDVLVFII